MYKTALTLIALVPAALAAQSAGASASANAQANARVGKTEATAATSVDAELAVARERRLPEEPIRRRVAEGRAKGAGEAQLAAAAQRVRLNMEAALEAMLHAGRARPTDEEVDRGGTMLERGYTRGQLEAVVKSAPSDRSLVVAFDVLTRLSERGVPVTRALAQVQSKLESRATDASIEALVAANARGGVGTAVPPAKVGAAAGTTGTVGGVIRRP